MGAYWGQARDLQRSEQNRTPPGRLSRHSATRMPELPEVQATRSHLVPVPEGDITWVTHLGMSGRLSVHRHGEPEVAHTNVVVGLDRGVEVRMVDPRTFGFVAAFTPDELDGMFNGRIGPDALDSLPNTRRLTSALAGRTAPLKALLLGQGVDLGLGTPQVGAH